MGYSTTKSYSELVNRLSFTDRFEYLKLSGSVGATTFGFDRYINQQFYASREWHDARNYVILRDNGCDLGVEGYELHADLLIHHMNPMSIDDVVKKADWILDPEYLITTSRMTHNAIHYGADNLLPAVVTSRKPHDTRLW